jgi:phage-related protein
MRVKNKQTQEELMQEVLTQEEPTVTLNNVAFSIFRNPDTQKWQVVKIPFDYKSMTAGQIEVLATEDLRDIAIERFKINVAKELL